jgi:hypothetical protein
MEFFMASIFDPRTKTEAFAEDTVVVFSNTNGASENFSLRLTKNSELHFSFPPMEILKKIFQTNSVTVQEINKFALLVTEPCLALAIYAPGRNFSESPDLYTATTNFSEPPILEYDIQSKKFFIEWNFFCPKSSWRQTKRIVSLPDLAHSYLYYSILNIPPEISANMEPANGEISFDLATIPLRNFSRINKPLAPPSNFVATTSNKKPAAPVGIIDPKFQSLSENGDYLISWNHLFLTQLPDEEQILNSQ